MSYFKCVLCNQIFTDEELQDVVQLSKSRSGKMVRFKDGSIHDIRHLSPGSHSRWHSRFGITDFPDCFFCKLDRDKLEQEKLENAKSESKDLPRIEEATKEVAPPGGQPSDNTNENGTTSGPVQPEEKIGFGDTTMSYAFKNIRR